MARYYLSNSVLELNEAAYMLGFEDPNSFGRAFRAWEGVPPSDWRETHRSSTPNQGCPAAQANRGCHQQAHLRQSTHQQSRRILKVGLWPVFGLVAPT
jgi:hypothetical protein